METRKFNKESIKPGDILVVSPKLFRGLHIKIGTLSKWTHVGIATDDKKILEATWSKKDKHKNKIDVNDIPIEEFIANKEVFHLIRPDSLNQQQEKLLKKFTFEKKNQGYTALHAALTTINLILPISLIGIFIYLIYETYNKYSFANNGIFATIIALCLAAILLILFFQFMKWSNRSTWGDDFTEKLYRKTRLGSWLMDRKYDMFCSRLVLLADREIGGPFWNEFPYPNEIQPKHFVKIGKKLGWAPTYT
jgi:hypothetical protein